MEGEVSARSVSTISILKSIGSAIAHLPPGHSSLLFFSSLGASDFFITCKQKEGKKRLVNTRRLGKKHV